MYDNSKFHTSVWYDESAYINPGAQGTGLIFIITRIVAAITRNMVTWEFAISSSSSHALIGGIAGAGLAALGVRAIARGTRCQYAIEKRQTQLL